MFLSIKGMMGIKVDLEKGAGLYMRRKERKKKKVRLAQPLGPAPVRSVK
jgi:hypothetical protein